jgi:hypothetical protein
MTEKPTARVMVFSRPIQSERKPVACPAHTMIPKRPRMDELYILLNPTS